MNPESFTSEPELPSPNALSLSFPSVAAAALLLMPPSSTPAASPMDNEDQIELPPPENRDEAGANGDKEILRTEVPDSEADSFSLRSSPVKSGVRSDTCCDREEQDSRQGEDGGEVSNDGSSVKEGKDVEKLDDSLDDLDMTPNPGTERLCVGILPVSEDHELALTDVDEVEHPLIIAVDERIIDDTLAVQIHAPKVTKTKLRSKADTEGTLTNNVLPASETVDAVITLPTELGEDVSQGFVSFHRGMQSNAITIEDSLHSATLESLTQIFTESPHSFAASDIQDQFTLISTSPRPLLVQAAASQRGLQSPYPTIPENLEVRAIGDPEERPEHDLVSPSSTNINNVASGMAESMREHLEQVPESTQPANAHDGPEVKTTDEEDVEMVNTVAQSSGGERLCTKVKDVTMISAAMTRVEQASVEGKLNEKEGKVDRIDLAYSQEMALTATDVAGAQSLPPLINAHRSNREGGTPSFAFKNFTGLASIPDSDDDDEPFSDATVSPIKVVGQDKAIPSHKIQSELRSVSDTNQIAQHPKDEVSTFPLEHKVVELTKTQTLKTPDSSFISIQTEHELQTPEPEIPSSPPEYQATMSHSRELAFSFKSIKRKIEQDNTIEDNPLPLQKLQSAATPRNNADENPSQLKVALENSILMVELKAIKMKSIQARNTALEAEIAEKRAILAEVTAHLAHPAAETVKRHIKLLHDYNDIRDVGQGLVGMIADNRGVRIGELYEEFGVGLKD